MVEIAKMMDWTYVSTVAAEGEYGEKGIASFVGMAKKHGICVAVSLKIRSDSSKELLNRKVLKFSSLIVSVGQQIKKNLTKSLTS
jgi:hypothetical protein